MNEPNPRSHQTNKYWTFVTDGWPIIAAIIGISWGIAITVGDVYVTRIVEREYAKKIMTEPLIQGLRNDLTSINGSLENLEGNDTEIRGQLSTVVSRLDTLISIQLSE